MNKTGVSLAYRAMEEAKENTRRENEEVKLRRPGGASYRTDADAMHFSRYACRDRAVGLYEEGNTAEKPFPETTNKQGCRRYPNRAGRNALQTLRKWG